MKTVSGNSRRHTRRAVVGASALLATSIGVVGWGTRAGTVLAQETIDVSAIRFMYSNPAPLDGPGLQMIDERFAFDYKPMLVPEATYTEKLTTVIASGDIPDIVVFKEGDSNYYTFAKQGAFIDLEPYVADYPTLAAVQPERLNVPRVDGTLYGIPTYYPPYLLTPSIRKDWLDRLGLAVPTTYEELKTVALAFTTDDPTGTGAETYGIAMGQNVNPAYDLGAWWSADAWYHRDDQGRLIPGTIGPGTQERIAFLKELYDAGAVTRDFAVLDWAATNAEFYGNKAGIFIGAPRGMSQDYYKGLKEIAPEAEVVPIPPFTAPDGSQGFLAGSGTNGTWALSARLKGDDDKIRRILEFLDVQRTFYPYEEQVATNADYTWKFGKEGVGWENVDGRVSSLEDSSEPKGLGPSSYFADVVPWPPTDDAIDYSRNYTAQPEMGVWAKALQDMWSSTTPYVDPTNGIIPPTLQEKGSELSTWVNGEYSRMIVGQRGLDTWDALVDEFLGKGGEAIVSEMNDALAKRDSA